MSARETAIEVIYDEFGHYRASLFEGSKEQAAELLDALLAARSEEPCPRCDGKGHWCGANVGSASQSCADCGGTGTRPLLAALIGETQ